MQQLTEEAVAAHSRGSPVTPVPGPITPAGCHPAGLGMLSPPSGDSRSIGGIVKAWNAKLKRGLATEFDAAGIAESADAEGHAAKKSKTAPAVVPEPTLDLGGIHTQIISRELSVIAVSDRFSDFVTGKILRIEVLPLPWSLPPLIWISIF